MDDNQLRYVWQSNDIEWIDEIKAFSPVSVDVDPTTGAVAYIVAAPQTKGGAGSGYYGHAGRPGARGGSAPGGGFEFSPAQAKATIEKLKETPMTKSDIQECPFESRPGHLYRGFNFDEDGLAQFLSNGVITRLETEFQTRDTDFSTEAEYSWTYAGGFKGYGVLVEVAPPQSVTVLSRDIERLKWVRGEITFRDVTRIALFKGNSTWSESAVVVLEPGYSLKAKEQATKGSDRSGNWGHAGVPGRRGGSAPGSGGLAVIGGHSDESAGYRHSLSQRKKVMDDAAWLAEHVPAGGGDSYTDPVCFSSREEKLAAFESMQDSMWITNSERAKVKAAGQEALEEAGIDEGQGHYWQKSWQDSSNDTGARQDELQYEAWKRAGMPDKLGVSKGMEIVQKHDAGLRNIGEEAKSDHNQAQRAIAYDSIYNRTQDYMRSKGMGPDDTVVLYRGMGIGNQDDPGRFKLGQAVSVKTRPLTSFALSFSTANDFKNEGTGVGRIFAVRVPAKAIFAHWSTGFGCMTENECVVLGDFLKDVPWVVVK